MKVVQIHKNGDMTDIDCKFTKKNICKILSQCSKSQGNNNIKLLYTWNIFECKLLCYGWNEGESGFENKHDLPPSGNSTFLENDSSESILFGDIFIVKCVKEKYSPIDIIDYSDSYNNLFSGFEDCEAEYPSSEELSEEEDHIIGEGQEEIEEIGEKESEIDYHSDNELEEDITDYI
tara:strand:- start:68 stop:598 length:531 start_codon:yes stop_codon:yes gene_type:complete